MVTRRTAYQVLTALILMVGGCKNDAYFGPVYMGGTDSIVTLSPTVLYVGCEGNFQYSNASLSVLDLEKSTIQNRVFQTQTGQPLGDVLQSMLLSGDTLALVLNNSGMIRLLDRNTFQILRDVEGLISPRHVCRAGGEYFVTDLYADEVTVMDRQWQQVVARIPVSGWTESMAFMGDEHLWVSRIERPALLHVNSATHVVANEVLLDHQPLSLYAVHEDVVVATGPHTDRPSVTVVGQYDRSGAMIDSIHVSGPFVAAVGQGGRLFVLTKRTVTVIDLNDMRMERTHRHELQTAYGMSVHPVDGRWFLADARDYLSNGNILECDSTGRVIATYECGVIPQAMLFYAE